MKLKNQYFILRHGETVYQTRKRDLIYPKEDNPSVRLTKRGKEQIKSVAKKLEKVGIDLIFSSDFFRTQQTAEIVAKRLGIKKVKYDKRLRDLNLGIYHGRKKEEFYQNFLEKYSKERFKKAPLAGESWSDCQKRMLNFLKDIEKRFKGKKILIVGHGDPLWLLAGGVYNYTYDKLLAERKNNFIKVGELRKI